MTTATVPVWEVERAADGTPARMYLVGWRARPPKRQRCAAQPGCRARADLHADLGGWWCPWHARNERRVRQIVAPR